MEWLILFVVNGLFFSILRFLGSALCRFLDVDGFSFCCFVFDEFVQVGGFSVDLKIVTVIINSFLVGEVVTG